MICHSCSWRTFTNKPVDIRVPIGTRVFYGTINEDVCNNCKDYTVSIKTLENVELNVALFALSDASDTDLDMITFARKALGMTKTEFSKALGLEDSLPEMSVLLVLAVKYLLLHRISSDPNNELIQVKDR